MSKSMPESGPLAGYRTGIDLLREAAGDKSAYTWADHTAVGLPMIVACMGCTMTMAGAGALIDADGGCWCVDCAEIRAGA